MRQRTESQGVPYSYLVDNIKVLLIFLVVFNPDPFFSCNIYIIHRIALAVGIQLPVALALAAVAVGRGEAAGLGVVVAGGEVVKPRL